MGRAPVSRPSRFAALRRLKIREHHAVIGLVLLVLALHLFVLPYWDEPYMDEAHYVPEAQSILHEGVITHPEHPPLAKLFIVAGIAALGDNVWGWRIPSVIFAVGSIAAFYFICRNLAGRNCAILASFLLVFESLTFVHSGLATLDGFAVAFMLLAFLFYLRDRYVLSGASLALAGLCKMTGLLGIGVILIHWLVVKRGKRPLIDVAYMVVLPVALFVLLMPLFDFAATREWLNPIDRIADMLSYHRALGIETLTPQQLADISDPWEWILSPTGHLSSATGGAIALINPLVWVLIIPSMVYMVYEWWKRRSQAALFVALWFAVICLLWIPLVLITDRVSYLYYFLPAAGAVCLAISMAAVGLWRYVSQRGGNVRTAWVVLGSYLALDVIAFLFLAPILKSLDFYLPFLSLSD